MSELRNSVAATPQAAVSGASPTSGVQEARRLAEEGRYAEAIALGMAENRKRSNPELEYLLLQWRHKGFSADPTKGRPDWPPSMADPFAGSEGIPEISPAELSTSVLGGSILNRGAVIVRGLLSPEEAEEAKAGIDHAFDARQASVDGAALDATLPWYGPIELEDKLGAAIGRKWAAGGALWASDSPRMAFDLLELYERKRVIQMIEEYLGERPALSVRKWTLRKVPPESDTGWHQDGAFLGQDVRTVNLWISLSHCGEDAPGLDLIPKRLPRILDTGTEGAAFDWSTGEAVVHREAADAPVVSPIFAPGDAILFDQLLMHRTGVRPGMTKWRWAIETWFFAPSTYPSGQLPLLI